MDIVDQTLRHWRQVPFAWGQEDCMLSVGDYIACCGGLDVTGRFRGAYDSQEAALALMQAHGGAGGLIDLTGIPRIDDEPLRGDVVTIATHDGDTIGAICTGDMIAVRLWRGVAEIRTRFVDLEGVWRCPV